MKRYPCLTLNVGKIKENAQKIADFCGEAGVKVCGVTKGFLADPFIASAMLDGGCRSFADSRIENLARLRKDFPGVPLVLLRIPMRSELEHVVCLTDRSLVSMPECITELERICTKLNKTYEAVLAFDLGDRREGILEKEMDTFAALLRQSPHVKLAGVAANFGCFAGVLPSAFALKRLVAFKDYMEKALDYAVPICSGGSTSSLSLIERGELPAGINELRIGEAILLGQDVTGQRIIPWLNQDTMFVEGQVVEVRRKPSAPEGQRGADAFGGLKDIPDRGERLRAIVALGRQDLPIENLEPLDKGIEILGGSSDHTLLDVEEAGSPLQWGDPVRFNLGYGALLGLMTSPYVRKEYKK